MMRRSAPVLLTALLSAVLALVPAPAASPPAAPATPLELVYLGDGRTLRLQIAVELDGRPLDAAWDDTFRALFTFLDRDGDGYLSREEARRAPSALRLRQLTWGLFFMAPGPPPPWEELDRRPADGRVSLAEFADYYRRHGVGRVQVAVGRAPATDALTDALLRALDRDGDGRVSRAEWQAAADTLHALDLNDDELISGDELVPGLKYPGALGGTLLTAWTPADPPSSLLDSFPFLRLPEDGSREWARRLVARRDRDGDGRLDRAEAGLSEAVFAALDTDRDGKLDAGELAGWRKLPPDHRLVVRLGRRPADAVPVAWAGRPAGDAVVLDLGRAWCALRAGESRLTADCAAACRLARQRFAEADTDGDGSLTAAEAARSSFAPLRDLFDLADRDGDGRLSAAEWSAYLDLQARLAAGQVILTILDHGRGLFELLDADRDGVLSPREQRSAWQRLEASGCLRGGVLDRSRLPRQLRCVISRGRPTTGRTPPARGPAWFRAMDRNGDGDVSRREFLGSDADFRRLDADGDGLISADEAERAAAPPGAHP